jgi:hypothetical protein
MADDLFCAEHVNTELVPAEDNGELTCWVCVALRVAERVDSWGVIGPDGQDRVVTKAEFVERLLARA